MVAIFCSRCFLGLMTLLLRLLLLFQGRRELSVTRMPGSRRLAARLLSLRLSQNGYSMLSCLCYMWLARVLMPLTLSRCEADFAARNCNATEKPENSRRARSFFPAGTTRRLKARCHHDAAGLVETCVFASCVPLLQVPERAAAYAGSHSRKQ